MKAEELKKHAVDFLRWMTGEICTEKRMEKYYNDWLKEQEEQ